MFVHAERAAEARGGAQAALLLLAALVAACALDGKLLARRATLGFATIAMYTVRVTGLPELPASPELAAEVRRHYEQANPPISPF